MRVRVRGGHGAGVGRWLGLAAAYLAVGALAVWLVWDRSGGAAVPALAPLAGDREAGTGSGQGPMGPAGASPPAPPEDQAAWRRDVAAAFLRLALPLVDAYREGGPERPWDLRRLFPLQDLRTREAVRLLHLSLPVLALETEESRPSPREAAPPVPPAAAADLAGGAAPAAPAPAGEPLVIVYSTHSHEAYTPDLRFRGAPPDVRPYADDMGLTVVRVAAELVRSLNEEGVPALHLAEVFDRNGLTGAYMESERGVRAALRRHPTARVLVDVHRDAAERGFTTTVAGGETYARLLFVVGMGNSRLPNPHWRDNQAFAREVSRRADALLEPDRVAVAGRVTPYPPLVRQLDDGDGDPWTFGRNGRFNQHLSPRAILVEFGGPGNTLREALRSARVVARALALALAVEAGGRS